MTQERVSYVNGKIVPESQAVVSTRDQGFTHGDAVFDMTRTFGGNVFRLDAHLDRLYDSLRYLRIDPGLSKEEMADISMKVVEANLPLLDENDDYWVGQRVTRGVSHQPENPTVVVECTPLPFTARAGYYKDGIPVITPSVRRTPPESLSPRAKTHNYLNMIVADQEVKAQDPEAWAILLDINGNLCEGMGSNIFLVKDGALVTPRARFVLGGISRLTTIELAQELNIETREADIDLFEAYTADEAFVTSTSLCICPVSSLNGAPYGDGDVPGPVTDRLQKAYSGLVGIDIVGQYLARLR